MNVLGRMNRTKGMIESRCDAPEKTRAKEHAPARIRLFAGRRVLCHNCDAGAGRLVGGNRGERNTIIRFGEIVKEKWLRSGNSTGAW